MGHTSIVASLASAFQIPLRKLHAPSAAAFSSAASQWAQRRAMQGLSTSRESAFPVTLVARKSASEQQQTSAFSTTATVLAKKAKKGRGKVDRRVKMIRYALAHPTKYLPKPLALTRLRALRHWTIHRGWQLHQRNLRTAHANELQRQWQAMREACEELRVGAGDGGRLFRQAMARKGYWGGRSSKGGQQGVIPGLETGDKGLVDKGREGGVPIEYARGLVDTPPRNGAWDHSWTRAS